MYVSLLTENQWCTLMAIAIRFAITAPVLALKLMSISSDNWFMLSAVRFRGMVHIVSFGSTRGAGICPLVLFRLYVCNITSARCFVGNDRSSHCLFVIPLN